MILGINLNSFRRSGIAILFSQLCFCGLSALLGLFEEPGHSHDQSNYRRALSYVSHRPPRTLSARLSSVSPNSSIIQKYRDGT